MRCLIKSVAFASGYKYHCHCLDGETHTVTDINFYMQTRYTNPPLIRPLKYGGFWNYYFMLAWMDEKPQGRFIVKIKPTRLALIWTWIFDRKEYKKSIKRTVHHCISAFTNKTEFAYYEPETNKCYAINYRFFLFNRIIAIYELS